MGNEWGERSVRGQVPSRDPHASESRGQAPGREKPPATWGGEVLHKEGKGLRLAQMVLVDFLMSSFQFESS